MNPTPHESTVAVGAAAKMAYTQAIGEGPAPTWEDLPVIQQHFWREAVLPLITVALEALPDRLDPVRTLVAHAEENLETFVPIAPLQTLLRPQT